MLLLFLLSLAASSCPKYQCADSSHEVTYPHCALYNVTYNTLYTKDTCKAEEVCPVGVPGLSPATLSCMDVAKVYVYPGEKCHSDSEFCLGTNLCKKDELCEGKQLNRECNYAYECNPGLYCNSTNCVKLIKHGENCKSFDLCESNNGCMKTLQSNTKVCTQYFSIQQGGQVDASECSSQNTSDFCESGYCFNKNTKYYCSESLQTAGKYPKQCNRTEDCGSRKDTVTGETYYSDCQCSYSSGISYCALMRGDEPGLSYQKWLIEWYASKGIKQCNSYNPLSLRCMKDNWSSTDYHEYTYNYYYFTQYSYLIDVKSCTEDIYFIEYKNAVQWKNRDLAMDLIVILFGVVLI